MRSRHEHNLQVNCVKWFRLQYPIYKNLLWATPNGGTRNVREAVSLKKEGVLSGVADLSLMMPKGRYHGYFIELKVGKNKQSENQIKFQKAVQKAGYKYEVIYTFERFVNRVNEYINK